MNSEKYIGLDVHQATIVVVVMDSTGKLVMECILETKAATILEFFAGLRGTLSVTFDASLAKGIKPTMVRLTLARKIAAITLTLWKKGENFDAEKLKSQAA
jgi:hypothetical protein